MKYKIRWSKDEIKELTKKYFYYIEHRREAEIVFNRKWNAVYMKAYCLGIAQKGKILMKSNKKCSIFLGCHVAERVLSHVFKDVQRMPIHNKGFDFICNKGFKIDVKSSYLHKNNTYQFIMNRNKIADYFLCIGFDNREDLNPQHIWLIKADDICMSDKSKRIFKEMSAISIKNNLEGLSKYSEYELTDKLQEMITCCNILKKS